MTLDGGKDWKKFMTGLPSVRVDDILIHPRDRDLIIGTHGRSIWIADDISALEQLKPAGDKDVTLFDPRPAILWKNDPQAQRHATNREFKAKNPQGGTAINIWAKTDLGTGKVEFLQGTTVASTMDVEIKAGMNRFQWPMRGPANAAATRRGRQAADAAAAAARAAAAAAGGGGGGDSRSAGTPPAAARPPTGGLRRPAVAAAAAADVAAAKPACPSWPAADAAAVVAAAVVAASAAASPRARCVEPGTYMVRLTVGDKVLNSSVVVMEDIWMRPQ